MKMKSRPFSAPGVSVKMRKVPKKQLDNPTELHPTKGGILRVTPKNVPMTTVLFLQQIRDGQIRNEVLLGEIVKGMNQLIKVVKDG